MNITIYVRPDAARALRGIGRLSAVDELRDIARAFGATLEPVHPDAQDADLASVFTANVPDPARATQAVERLRSLPIVEAAYLKPADEPPAP